MVMVLPTARTIGKRWQTVAFQNFTNQPLSGRIYPRTGPPPTMSLLWSGPHHPSGENTALRKRPHLPSFCERRDVIRPAGLRGRTLSFWKFPPLPLHSQPHKVRCRWNSGAPYHQGQLPYRAVLGDPLLHDPEHRHWGLMARGAVHCHSLSHLPPYRLCEGGPPCALV